MSIKYIENKEGLKLAYHFTPTNKNGEDLPPVLFLSGFKSDMEGTKALYLQKQCEKRGQAFIRFDYSGHGISEGKFENGTIGKWKNDALCILSHLTDQPALLVGSSMGGWISLLIARDCPEKIAGMIGLAAAPDFTREISARMNDDQKIEMNKCGFIAVANDYSDEPYIFTKALIDDGEDQCLLDSKLNLRMPVCLIQGMKDDDVEWQKAFRIKNAVGEKADNVEVILLEYADHRLSTPENLTLIDTKIQELVF